MKRFGKLRSENPHCSIRSGNRGGKRTFQTRCAAAITIDAAKIIDLDKRIGSLEKNKDADIAMYDGDPFEYTMHCVGTIINGKIVNEIVR